MARRLLLCLLVGVVCSLCSCRFVPEAPKVPEHTLPPGSDSHPAVSVTYLYFSESNSCFKRVQGYEFRAEGNQYTAYFYMANEDELYPVQVDQAWADTLSGFVSQYDMVSWNGFSGHDSMLMDGTQFSIDFTLADGTRIQAAGYGEFPDGYGGASSAIDAHFMQLLPEDMRDW